jgi:hypothetical protein
MYRPKEVFCCGGSETPRRDLDAQEVMCKVSADEGDLIREGSDSCYLPL